MRTRQNKPWRVGRYRLDLTRGLDTRSLADGAYRVDVETTDTAGNRSRNATTVVVRTAAPVPVAKTGR
ncbi:MAG TPA: hypothetical protein VLB86_08330 [Gaiellaceae bacterium]|nr:hypothetical protein [Gaiellaceae bacterium]